MSTVFVRKTGSHNYPWEARCTEHREQEIYLTSIGGVGFNTRGVGNRLWEHAMWAALGHWKKWHS